MGKKWNSDAKPAEKLLALYTLLLFSGREMSLTELANDLCCSKQTVSRLLNQLDAAHCGKLLRAKKGREATYKFDRPQHLPKIGLDAEGLYMLTLCRDFIFYLLPTKARKQIEATLQNACAYTIGDTETEKAVPVHGKFADSIGKGHIDYGPHEGVFQIILAAIRNQNVCDISYRSSIDKEQHTFSYAPKRLIAYRESIHIIGWVVSESGTVSPRYETTTTLALQRIVSAVQGVRTSRHLPDPKEAGGAFGIVEGKSFIARVLFMPEAATYVAERQWSVGQKITKHKNGSLTLKLHVQSLMEFVAWILSFGDAAEAKSPVWLRKILAEQIARLAERYTPKERS